MISLGRVNENGVLDIALSGRLTRDDYERTLPALEALLARHGRLRFLIRIEDFDGFELGALRAAIRFDVKHRHQFGRIAVVGKGAIAKWTTQFSKLLVAAELRFFGAEEAAAAESWVSA